MSGRLRLGLQLSSGVLRRLLGSELLQSLQTQTHTSVHPDDQQADGEDEGGSEGKAALAELQRSVGKVLTTFGWASSTGSAEEKPTSTGSAAGSTTLATALTI